MNILTFDIEEWFHILDNKSTKTFKEWNGFESRFEKNMEIIFDIMETHNMKATFFCLGWIAEKYPEIIKKIAAMGYEIGSHTHSHQLVYEQKQAEFAKDLDYSIKVLEDLSGQKIKTFRAPGFSIKEECAWAFEEMLKQGIEIDSSIFPTARAHGGYASYTHSTPSILEYKGMQLKELPINYSTKMGFPVVFSGGGYFRFFPYFLIKKWTKESPYVMSYFHPRDFDHGQPVINDLPLFRKFKSYVGLKNARNKLDKWLDEFNFTDIQTLNNKIDWEQVSVVKLK